MKKLALRLFNSDIAPLNYLVSLVSILIGLSNMFEILGSAEGTLASVGIPIIGLHAWGGLFLITSLIHFGALLKKNMTMLEVVSIPCALLLIFPIWSVLSIENYVAASFGIMFVIFFIYMHFAAKYDFLVTVSRHEAAENVLDAVRDTMAITKDKPL